MENFLSVAFWVLVLVSQTAVCIFSRKAAIKLIPTLIPVGMMAADFAVYALTENWAFLILAVIALVGVLVAACVWLFYGLVILIQKILDLSRKNT